MNAREAALVDRFDGYKTVVEIGVGRRGAVAGALAESGCTVIATDVHDRSVPEPVEFVRDDVTDPDLAVYAEADLLYALNLPPELHQPVHELARKVEADCAFTTLGGDPALVPVRRERVPNDVLYWAGMGRD